MTEKVAWLIFGGISIVLLGASVTITDMKSNQPPKPKANTVFPPGYFNDQPKASPRHIYEMGDIDVIEPTVISSPPVEYTDEARNARFEGIVKILVTIDETGTPRDIKLVNPPGLGLDVRIMSAIARTKYKPATRNGLPVPIHEQVNMYLPR